MLHFQTLKKTTPKRARTNNKNEIIKDISYDTENILITVEDEQELQAAGKSILPHDDETEVIF